MDKLDIEKIKQNITNILEDTFSDKNKHVILEHSDRLNFACPYCGDSTNSRKRRGNLYINNLSYHCFNCGHHCDYIKFMHDFEVPVGDGNLDVIADTIKHGKKKKSTTFDIEIFDMLDKMGLSRIQLRKRFHLTEIIPGEMYDYLCKRCLQNKINRFMYNKKHNELWVLNMVKSGKIIGVQIRSFDPDKVKYRTYNISKIYQYMGMEFPEKDEETVSMLNQTSITFNITNIDLFDRVYVFEGAIDSMFLKNSVGISGVHRTFDLVENLPETRYFFDNDKSGYKRTAIKLKEGKHVFMWKKFLNDLDLPRDIKDFNDLIVYMINNKIKYNFNEIEQYFTNEELDLLNV